MYKLNTYGGAQPDKAFCRFIRALGIQPPATIEIGIPRNEAFGDVSATVALSLSKITKKSAETDGTGNNKCHDR